MLDVLAEAVVEILLEVGVEVISEGFSAAFDWLFSRETDSVDSHQFIQSIQFSDPIDKYTGESK